MRAWVKLVLGAALVVAAGLLLAACHGGPHTFTVTTTVDGADVAPGDGVCEATAGVGDCTLRAAITEASATNGTNEVLVPEGTYALTLAGSDDAGAVGDLDASPAGTLRLTGQGAGAAIDVGGLDGGLDVHSGKVEVRFVGVTGATGPGVRLRSGVTATVLRAAAHGNGGAGLVVDAGAQAVVRHSTLSGNGAGGLAVDGTVGGGYLTVTANLGGGIVGTAAPSLGQSIVAGQQSGADCALPVATAGGNLDSDDSCWLSAPDDQGDVTVGLAPLTADLVPFHPLAPGSRAMDAVAADGGSCGVFLATVDQRGQPRPAGKGCDAGAIEAQGGLSLVVDSAFDILDAVPGDGLCDTGAGVCTLRAAITEANLAAGPDTITLAADPTLARPGANEDANATGDLDVLDALTVVGQGHTVHAGGIDRAIDHRFGWLAIQDATITGGVTGSEGGGIDSGDAHSIHPSIPPTFSGGTLELTDVRVEGNRAGSGGGIDALGALRLTDVAIEGNTSTAANGRGGGLVWTAAGVSSGTGPSLWGRGFGTAKIERTTIAGNDAEHVGGASLAGVATVDTSTIAGNEADGDGGGLFVGECFRPGFACGSDVTVRRSTVAGNVAAGDGGGVWIERDELFEGAGASVHLVASTVARNGAGELGGGIRARFGGVVASGAVVGINAGGDCDLPVTSEGYNLSEDGSCGFAEPTDLAPQAPVLGPLADNGGPTATVAPIVGSPLVDAIPVGAPGLCDGTLPEDQRGEPRPLGPSCDVGAVEGPVVVERLVVDAAHDAPDAVPGDDVCDDGTGACTLRAAIDELHVGPPFDDTITIAPGIDPVLSLGGTDEDANATGDLDLRDPVVLVGGGATIDAAGLDRVLDVHSPGVVLEDVTVTGGRLTAPTSFGGGILVREVGDVVLREATVAGNRIDGADGRGAGLALLDGVPGAGGTIERSTISGNVAVGFGAQGGGLYALGGHPVVVTLSTISGNRAFSGAATLHGGFTNLQIRASTITGNTGYQTFGGGGNLSVTGSIVGPGATTMCSYTLFPSGSVNVLADSTCTGLTGIVADALLGPLTDNGGPTPTHLPQLGSPVRDLLAPGSGSCTSALPVDQRGQPRPLPGNGCDVGSVESP